jgi:alanine-glyoxylate transaminase/serine-glyoxylate transaminase/serine-pyruvate transaminase
MRELTGRHFLQVPGPSNVPETVLLAMARATIDHRGPEFKALTKTILDGFQSLFGFGDPVVMYPSSGTGAWVAALINCLSPGDKVLAFETGHFASLWKSIAEELGLEVAFEPGDWRSAVEPDRLEAILKEDAANKIKAVCVVHNETSTAVTSDIGAIRQAMDAANHPALLLVDTISSLGSIPYDHKNWGVDVTVGGSQKGLMLPPGLGLNVVSEKALDAAKTATSPKAYWDWEAIIGANANGFFPYTPPTNLMFGLAEAQSLLSDEGMTQVYARHARHGTATRAAVQAWGLETVCRQPERHSDSLTALLMPDGVNADEVRRVALTNFNISLGTGLGKLAKKAFRIGHLGDFNDLMLTGTLTGVEMALEMAGVDFQKDGVRAAMQHLQADR